MSTSDKPQKISLAFHGGQVLAARVKPDELTRLRGALGSGGWHQLGTEEGTVMLDLGRLDYLLIDEEDHKVGF
jgi:hypothetical protein